MKTQTYNKHIERKAKQFKLNSEDLHNLYDLFYMIDFGILRTNKMDKWATVFFDKLEEIILWDLKEELKEKK